MAIGEKVKARMQKWLDIQPSYNPGNIVIREPYSFETDCIRNRIWYRGDADELKQLYAQIPSVDAGCSRFWAAVPTGGKIRKLHTGLPGVMVDVLTGIVVGDYDGMAFQDDDGDDDEALTDRWKAIQDDIAFVDVIEAALTDTLITGGGAFRVSWDLNVSDKPSLEFFGEDRTESHYRSGVLVGVSFYTDHYRGRDKYQLEEIREPGKIRYVLRDMGGREVEIQTIPELSALRDITLPDNIMTAIPFRVWKNSKWPNRGRSVYNCKTDDFDALDEIVSQWLDAVRNGRVQRYIPEDMVPRDPKNGLPMSVDSFGSDFISVNNPTRESGNENHKIDVVQPDIRYDAFKNSYVAALDLCLQGILSPATLGINIAATASGEAKKEGKDVTGFTRNRITAKLEAVLPKVAGTLLQVDDWLHERPVGHYSPTISFGEYAAPDFGTRVKAIRDADACGGMSVEAKVEEIWGGSKPKEWIEAEIQRIKQEKGIVEAGEPSGGDELP